MVIARSQKIKGDLKSPGQILFDGDVEVEGDVEVHSVSTDGSVKIGGDVLGDTVLRIGQDLYIGGKMNPTFIQFVGGTLRVGDLTPRGKLSDFRDRIGGALIMGGLKVETRTWPKK
jgi:predicted acyltransferase (DUF342 family)